MRIEICKIENKRRGTMWKRRLDRAEKITAKTDASICREHQKI
jgi:hypothetical protein